MCVWRGRQRPSPPPSFPLFPQPALLKLAQPLQYLDNVPTIYQRLRLADFGVVFHCTVAATSTDPHHSCAQAERMVRQLLLHMQPVAATDLACVGVVSLTTAAQLGLSPAQPLATYTLRQGLTPAPLTLIQHANTSLTLLWLQREYRQHRDLPFWRPFEVEKVLSATGNEPSPAFSTSTLAVNATPRSVPQSPAGMALYLPLLPTAYNATLRFIYLELSATVRAVALALQGRTPRSVVAGMIDSDTTPDMLQRSWVIDSAAAAVEAAVSGMGKNSNSVLTKKFKF